MIKVGDKVYHVYNGNIRGTVKELREVKTQVQIETGSASKSLVAIVEYVNEKQQKAAIQIPIGDLMRA